MLAAVDGEKRGIVIELRAAPAGGGMTITARRWKSRGTVSRIRRVVIIAFMARETIRRRFLRPVCMALRTGGGQVLSRKSKSGLCMIK
jgi:hypothetical protein